MAANATSVRRLGNLPPVAQLEDSIIEAQLPHSARKLKRLIGDYSAFTGDDLVTVNEAEACYCMSLLIPILNTMYLHGMPTAQVEKGDMAFYFRDTSEAEIVAEQWEKRAEETVREWIDDVDNEGVKMRFMAI